MTTTVRKVQQAPTPQQAMLAIAEALDRIEAKLDQQPAAEPDTWGSWGSSLPSVELHSIDPDAGYASVTYEDPSRNAQQIEAIKQLMAVTTDDEDLQALQAKLRLLQDEGGRIENIDPGVRVRSLDDGSNLTVDIPAASPERQAGRRFVATRDDFYSFLSTPGLTKEEFVEAYAKGGPMWLYLGDRDAIMAMPPAWRQAMIQDIEQDAPLQAQEVARDILKDVDAGTPEAVDRVYGE